MSETRAAGGWREYPFQGHTWREASAKADGIEAVFALARSQQRLPLSQVVAIEMAFDAGAHVGCQYGGITAPGLRVILPDDLQRKDAALFRMILSSLLAVGFFHQSEHPFDWAYLLPPKGNQ